MMDENKVNIFEKSEQNNVEEISECCQSHKHKDRSEKEQRNLINRLSRLEGQIRGIKGMVEKGAYCTDILTQVAAATSALNSFGRVLLENHMRTCVVEDIRAGKDDTVDELMDVLKRMIK